MYLDRQRPKNRSRSRDPLEKKMDQWFETGRQLVDGVAGNRPGQRRSGTSIGSGLDDVGRWVGDKLDWFFEEEDDWIEPWQQEYQHEKEISPNKKRPLQAISLRGPKSISPANKQQKNSIDQDLWPDESSFRVEKWKRNEEKEIDVTRNQSLGNSDLRRPLPKSSRRRNHS